MCSHATVKLVYVWYDVSESNLCDQFLRDGQVRCILWVCIGVGYQVDWWSRIGIIPGYQVIIIIVQTLLSSAIG